MSKSLLTTTRLLGLAVALAAPVLSMPASANVRTSVTGTACHIWPDFVRVSSGGGDRYDGSGSFSIGSDATDTSVSIGTFCGLQRNLPLTTAGLSDLEIRFTGHNTTSADTICSGISLRPDGTIVKSVSKTITVPPTGTVTMDFGGAVNASASKGTYFVTCMLPFTVHLNSIYHSEIDGVDGN
jgi:hypothetical protein